MESFKVLWVIHGSEELFALSPRSASGRPFLYLFLSHLLRRSLFGPSIYKSFWFQSFSPFSIVSVVVVAAAIVVVVFISIFHVCVSVRCRFYLLLLLPVDLLFISVLWLTYVIYGNQLSYRFILKKHSF